MLIKRTTALVTAAATALTLGAAAPAQAADEDLIKLLFGALALGAVAAAVDDHNDGRTTTTTRNVTINRHYHKPHRSYTPKRTVTVTRPYGKTFVPANCQRRLRTAGGERTFVGQPCLQGAGYSTAKLPRACQRTLDFGQREVRAWGVPCLERNGFRLR